MTELYLSDSFRLLLEIGSSNQTSKDDSEENWSGFRLLLEIGSSNVLYKTIQMNYK